MITRDTQAFLDFASELASDFGPATARAVFLVAPDGFARAEQSAGDNRYMADAGAYDAARASQQHRALHRALATALPTVASRAIRTHPMRCSPTMCSRPRPAAASSAACATRAPARGIARGIRGFFSDILGYHEVDLSTQEHPCELPARW